MINGAHFLLYSKDPEADRAFLRDLLEFRSVDAGRGWLIFALPPAEIAVHPASEDSAAPSVEDGVVGTALYFMCYDLRATMGKLRSKGVNFSALEETPWGIVTTSLFPVAQRSAFISPSIQLR
jgi:hypothetical protein